MANKTTWSVTEFAATQSKTVQAIRYQCRTSTLPKGYKAEMVGKTWIIQKKA